MWRPVDHVKQLIIVAGDDVEAGRVEVGNGGMAERPCRLNVDNDHWSGDGVDARQRDVLPLHGLGEIRQTRNVVNSALHLETDDSALIRRAVRDHVHTSLRQSTQLLQRPAVFAKCPRNGSTSQLSLSVFVELACVPEVDGSYAGSPRENLSDDCFSRFLDPEGGSQNATLVVLLVFVVVISSL